MKCGGSAYIGIGLRRGLDFCQFGRYKIIGGSAYIRIDLCTHASIYRNIDVLDFWCLLAPNAGYNVSILQSGVYIEAIKLLD